MSKKVMSDMIPPEKRTIRRVSLSSSQRKTKNGGTASEKKTPKDEEETVETSSGMSGGGNGMMKNPKNPSGGGGKKFRKGLWAGAALSVALVLFVSFSLVFAGARVEVQPKLERVTLDGTFEAFREPNAGELGFDILTVKRNGSEVVTATGEEQVDTKASGTIVIYNDYNSRSQRLIKNTRFETPDGLIYRIPNSVVVPGQQEVDGETVPGSIEVEVFADTSGEEYNIGLTDFTIPGFKGDPRFNDFYARSKTPMAGGFSGLMKTVAPEELTLAKSAIHNRLREELVNEARVVQPEGTVLLDDAVFIDFVSLPNEDAGGGKVAVKEEGILRAVIFDHGELAQHIATNTLADYDGGAVRIDDPSTITFNSGELERGDPAEIEFSLSGPAEIVWVFDEARLKEDLAGKLKRATETVLSGYPAIEQAAIVVRPFWKREFPENPEKIRIETILEK